MRGGATGNLPMWTLGRGEVKVGNSEASEVWAEEMLPLSPVWEFSFRPPARSAASCEQRGKTVFFSHFRCYCRSWGQEGDPEA